MVSTIQSTKVDKETIIKPESVKHVVFATDKVKEKTTPLNYNKTKPLVFGGGNAPSNL